MSAAWSSQKGQQLYRHEHADGHFSNLNYNTSVCSLQHSKDARVCCTTTQPMAVTLGSLYQTHYTPLSERVQLRNIDTTPTGNITSCAQSLNPNAKAKGLRFTPQVTNAELLGMRSIGNHLQLCCVDDSTALQVSGPGRIAGMQGGRPAFMGRSLWTMQETRHGDLPLQSASPLRANSHRCISSVAIVCPHTSIPLATPVSGQL